jgi:Flp pilus assembly protein TadG
MRSDRGSITMWTLGLSIMLLGFGGLAVDFWRALALQRELAAVADSMVVAAASGVDEDRYRATGEVIIDPRQAVAFGSAYLETQDVVLVDYAVTTAADGSEVAVVVEGELDLGLIGILVDDTAPLEIRATAVAEPVLIP